MKIFWCFLMAFLIAWADALIKVASKQGTLLETLLSPQFLWSIALYLIQMVVVAITFRMENMGLWMLMLIFVAFYAVLGLVFAYNMFGEIPTKTQILGAGLAIVAIFIMSK